MAFADSSTISIALKDPVLQYGKTFRVSNIYLTSSAKSQSYSNVPASYLSPSLFEQEFENKIINIKWDIIDPKNNYIYQDNNSIISNPYVSGFDVIIYENSGDTTGLDVVQNRKKVFEKTNITGNSLEYTTTGSGHRNYSMDVVFTDFTGNQSSGVVVSRNPPPSFGILGTGMAQGSFYSYYSGAESDFLTLALYNFTGLTSGTSGDLSQESGYFSTATRGASGASGYTLVELTPGADNYVMALGEDRYSTGVIKGYYKPQVRITGAVAGGIIGQPVVPVPTGYLSGNPLEGYLIPYNPQIQGLTGVREEAGDAIYYSLNTTNYNTGSDLITTCYKIHGTGDITGAVAGYNEELLLDYGVLFDPSYGPTNTGYNYFFDNSLSLQNGLATGIATELETITGVGVTGSGLFGVGAGDYWIPPFPAYSGYKYVAPSGMASGGDYTYGYFDPLLKRFGCATQGEIASGTFAMPGIYSMPKNDPNSYEIKYRTGPAFQESYEQAASYLNSIGEMPAVVINNSQLSKMKSVSSAPGWVGLRRKKVGILTGLFSEYGINQAFFNGTDFSTGQSADLSIVNTSGYTETSRMEINDVGEYWAWTNASGNQIYKYAGSGYYKVREAELNVQLKDTGNNVITGSTTTGEVPFMEINRVTGISGDKQITFQYTFEDNYYKGNAGDVNFDVTQIDLYTGSSLGFAVSPQNLAQTYTGVGEFGLSGIQSEVTYLPPTDSQTPPGFYKMVPFDAVGSGVTANINQIIADTEGGNPNTPMQVAADDQLTIASLDTAHSNGDNFIVVTYPFEHRSGPVVTQSLMYTGPPNVPVAYLGAMLSGSPTTTQATFVLTSVPPGNGYILYVRSASF